MMIWWAWIRNLRLIYCWWSLKIHVYNYPKCKINICFLYWLRCLVFACVYLIIRDTQYLKVKCTKCILIAPTNTCTSVSTLVSNWTRRWNTRFAQFHKIYLTNHNITWRLGLHRGIQNRLCQNEPLKVVIYIPIKICKKITTPNFNETKRWSLHS